MDLAEKVERHRGALTVPELAELLSVSHEVLYRMVRSGNLPAFRIRNVIRLDPALTAEWIRTRMTVQHRSPVRGRQPLSFAD